MHVSSCCWVIREAIGALLKRTGAACIYYTQYIQCIIQTHSALRPSSTKRERYYVALDATKLASFFLLHFLFFLFFQANEAHIRPAYGYHEHILLYVLYNDIIRDAVHWPRSMFHPSPMLISPLRPLLVRRVSRVYALAAAYRGRAEGLVGLLYYYSFVHAAVHIQV